MGTMRSFEGHRNIASSHDCLNPKMKEYRQTHLLREKNNCQTFVLPRKTNQYGNDNNNGNNQKKKLIIIVIMVKYKF